MAERTKKEIYEYLNRAEVGSVGTSNMGKPRQRMMHFAADEDFHLYLTSMKGDPKVIQWSNIPETAILIHQGKSFMEMEECEIMGRASIVRTDEEREKAAQLLAPRSPIVAQFKDMEALDRLEFIKITPLTVKYRYVPEILQGEAPTVYEFKENQDSSNDRQELKSRFRAWKEAVRPLSLTASLIPLLLGGAMAFSLTEMFTWSLFILTLLGGLMVQAGTNMINDWKDAERDADNTQGIRPFTGGSKMIQLGLISKADMGFFGILLTITAGLIGLFLVFQSGWGILPLIAYGLLAGFFYTNGQGKFSFINLSPGIAELLIATTYGIGMTLGSFYVQTGSYSLEVFLISVPVALLITNVLLINQFPDAAADEASDKNTLVVRIGKEGSKNVLISLFIIGYSIIAMLPLFDIAPYSIYLSYLSLPFMIQAIKYAQRNYDKPSTDIISSNAHTAIHHLFTGLLLTISYLYLTLNVWIIASLFIAAILFVIWVWRYIERQRRVMNDFKKAFS
ncbi:UbiA family prenyltransferase [Salipaludibacillus daqingensis]|uniref:UbiA family prenyltransferase n=1 Tax=Salipaludibacillus daqingensis TaxID=3041001 RepID=UPI002475AEF5|nr:UbiA family prenyltransferase [Salipaludibacillus daqingensis]